MALREGNIVGHLGLMGSGKTMGMYRLALYQSRPIYCNFDAAYSTRLRRFSELNNVYDACFCVDELQLSVNSREFAQKTNIDFGKFLELRVRKRGSVFQYTTQDINRIDVAVREITSHIYYYERIYSATRPASKVTVYKRRINGTYDVIKRFRMLHMPLRGLYWHRDEDVEIEFDVTFSLEKRTSTRAGRDSGRDAGGGVSEKLPNVRSML